MMGTFFMVVGFVLSSYSVIANDAIQTLGTFLSSNRERPWWMLWIYVSSILVFVVVYGWWAYGGDVSYGRLPTKFPVPAEFTWIHAVPPLALLILTRYGIPVSTTFLVLTVFAPSQLGSMLEKSLMGYAVAFVSAAAVYLIISNAFEKMFFKTRRSGEKPSWYWYVFQWSSTAFLWSMWLVQDLANIYVYMPTRQLDITIVLVSLLGMVLLQGVILYGRGGKIQEVVTEKSSTEDIRSATIIDLVYGIVLYYFKNINNVPMSTTWVFLGLLGGREIAMAIRLRRKYLKTAGRLVLRDIQKAGLGLLVSVLLAFGLPVLHGWF